MELNRKISQEIQNWYKNEKKALLIKGARQVGKTHIIRTTLNEIGCQYIEFNLIENPQVIPILKNSTSIDELVLGLSVLTNKKIKKNETVIFLDEIQKFKEIVTKIKFLVDDGSFKFILSGSLLGVELYSIESAPVGYLKVLTMYPLDFEEFLQITNITEEVKKYLKTSFNERKPVLDEINKKMLSLFNQYLLVGGMPEAVVKFAETRNLNDVLAIHKDIFRMYKLDFSQYEAEDKKLIISNIYDLVPAELLKQNRRFNVSDLNKGLHFERVRNSFLWLENAGVVITVFNATEPKIPLKLSEKQSLFKLYLSDIGMLTSLYGMSTKAKILNFDKDLNGGGLYENAVACELASKGFQMHYYNSNRLGELDFVIDYHGQITPIEVKSGKDYSIHSALNNCIKNSEYEIEEAFVFANCNIEKKDKITYLPVYMIGMLDNNQSDILVDEIKF